MFENENKYHDQRQKDGSISKILLLFSIVVFNMMKQTPD